jgi:hypothetical protein
VFEIGGGGHCWLKCMDDTENEAISLVLKMDAWIVVVGSKISLIFLITLLNHHDGKARLRLRPSWLMLSVVAGEDGEKKRIHRVR